jgi:hypothetical protein
MGNYLKIYRTREEYDSYCERPVYSHIIDEVLVIFNNHYNSCQDGGCPQDGCCDLDGGYYA